MLSEFSMFLSKGCALEIFNTPNNKFAKWSAYYNVAARILRQQNPNFF